MPRLEALELFAPRGPAHEVVLPAGLRALTVVGLRPRRADAWLSALPRGLGHLTLCDAELALGRAPAWPPGLRSLSLQDCTWGHATTLDLQGLTALALVELVAPDAALKMLAVRLPDDGDAPPVGAAYEADPPQRVGRNPWDVARAPRSLRITKRGR